MEGQDKLSLLPAVITTDLTDHDSIFLNISLAKVGKDKIGENETETTYEVVDYDKLNGYLSNEYWAPGNYIAHGVDVQIYGG